MTREELIVQRQRLRQRLSDSIGDGVDLEQVRELTSELRQLSRALHADEDTERIGGRAVPSQQELTELEGRVRRRIGPPPQPGERTRPPFRPQRREQIRALAVALVEEDRSALLAALHPEEEPDLSELDGRRRFVGVVVP